MKQVGLKQLKHYWRVYLFVLPSLLLLLTFSYFPALSAIGDVAIPHILRQEHDLLRNLSEFMLPAVEKARADGFTGESWAEFCELALELVERQISHIQKEEMGLLPTLSGLFEDDRDGELVMLYAEAS